MAPKRFLLLFTCLLSWAHLAHSSIHYSASDSNVFNTSIVVGAERTTTYLPLLAGKKVGVVGNQTTRIGTSHLVDSLLALGVEVKKVFAPEHGFRGNADAGEHVKDGKDAKTGLPIISLYGKHKKPTVEDFQDLELIIFDIQDVGARFYTYISTLHYIMEASAEQGKPVLVLDRPNPNGFYVDGPVLQEAQTSFIGKHPVPVVHGMTIGEYAQMINGEGWLEGGVQCELQVITCENYTHQDLYKLPVRPSPNLPNMSSIWLYPSLCFFEGTQVSVGRGTELPFQIIGFPGCEGRAFDFIPESMPGAAKNPKHKDELCTGINLYWYGQLIMRNSGKLHFSWLMEMYEAYPNKSKFFLSNGFFHLLAGNKELMQQIKAGTSEQEIRVSWEPALSEYKAMRKKYLLYPDFE